MSTLLQEIEAQISGLKTGVTSQNVGTVREIGDGVAKIEGLSDAMLNEMLDFGNGVVGLALNLEETEVGAIILGEYTGIKEGQEVRTTGKLLQVPVGKAAPGPRRQRPRPAHRRQRPDQHGSILSGGKNRPRHHQPQIRSPSPCKRASWPWTR